MAKNKKTTNAHIEKTLTIAGLMLVILGCIASLFYGYINQRFINEPILDSIYYFNYIVLLGGGFAAGYLLTRKGKARLFSGVAYALLTVLIYLLIDVMRAAIVRNLFDTPSFPWERIMFEGEPAIALALTIFIAITMQRKAKQLDFSTAAKWLFIIAFVITQLYQLISGLIMNAVNPSDSGLYITPIWLVIGSYIINPLFITLLAYLLFSRVKNGFQRLFYSVFTGAFSSILFLILWNFRTDPSLSATNTFETISITITLLAVSILLWQARLATKR